MGVSEQINTDEYSSPEDFKPRFSFKLNFDCIINSSVKANSFIGLSYASFLLVLRYSVVSYCCLVGSAKFPVDFFTEPVFRLWRFCFADTKHGCSWFCMADKRTPYNFVRERYELQV